ncbi:MAG: tetratricopeptide repeat protein [Candidatus Moraniibacteriota bacterium]
MWYLIVPPIVIVASLLFVLWYLSSKGADPFIARKVSQLENSTEQTVSFFRTKKFLLRVLEKTAYRFKVISLQMHNALNDITQSLKAKRKDFQEKTENMSPSEPEKETLTVFEEILPGEVVVENKPVRNEQPMTILRRNRIEKTIQMNRSEDLEVSARPMVSEKMVHPEVSYRKTLSDIAFEESLIARIATNPKDFGSYEKLGDYYLEIGNVKDAKECYKQVLKLSPAERMVKIKIRRLEKIISQNV